MVSGLSYGLLDISNTAEIEAYEKAMFRAFVGSEIETLDKIWDFDTKNRRLKTKIPYKGQLIFVGRFDDRIVSGLAINTDMKNRLQLEMLGFSIDKSQPGLAEGLAVFNLQVFDGKNPIIFLVRDFAFDKIMANGITKMYGTCSKKKLRGYSILGWMPIDERDICGEREYLLEIPLDNNERVF